MDIIFDVTHSVYAHPYTPNTLTYVLGSITVKFVFWYCDSDYYVKSYKSKWYIHFMMVVSFMHTHINGHQLENKLYVNVNDLTYLT